MLPLNKMLKRIIIGFTIVCGVFLIIFCFELIQENREAPDRGGEPAVSGGANGTEPGGSGANGTEPGGSGGEEPGGPNGNGGEVENGGAGGRPGVRPTPTGTRQEIIVTGDGGKLIYYIDATVLSRAELPREESLEMLSVGGNLSATLEIRFILMTQNTGALVETLLESDYNAFVTTIRGEDYIGLSELRGVMGAGERNGTNYEIWIHGFTAPGSMDLGLAFILTYQTEAQKEALRTVLDSLDME